MKKCSFLIVVFFYLVACHTPRQATLPVVQRDTVIIGRIDTVVRAFPLYVGDTILMDFDTASFLFDWKKAWTKVTIEKDTVWRLRVNTQIKVDTVYSNCGAVITLRYKRFEGGDSIFVLQDEKVLHSKFLERPETGPDPAQSLGGKIPWWIWAVLTALFSLLGYNLYKKKS